MAKNLRKMEGSYNDFVNYFDQNANAILQSLGFSPISEIIKLGFDVDFISLENWVLPVKDWSKKLEHMKMIDSLAKRYVISQLTKANFSFAVNKWTFLLKYYWPPEIKEKQENNKENDNITINIGDFDTKTKEIMEKIE